MTKVIWTNQALSELQLIRDYIRQFSPGAAGKVAGAISKAGNGLATSHIADVRFRGRIGGK